VVDKFCGEHAHLSKVTDHKSTARESRKQVNVAQSHTNYQVSMMAEELGGIIYVAEATDIIRLVSSKKLACIILLHALFNYLKMKDGHQAIAEVHQKSF
jgi:hypothetical protein